MFIFELVAYPLHRIYLFDCSFAAARKFYFLERKKKPTCWMRWVEFNVQLNYAWMSFWFWVLGIEIDNTKSFSWCNSLWNVFYVVWSVLKLWNFHFSFEQFLSMHLTMSFTRRQHIKDDQRFLPKDKLKIKNFTIIDAISLGLFNANWLSGKTEEMLIYKCLVFVVSLFSQHHNRLVKQQKKRKTPSL